MFRPAAVESNQGNGCGEWSDDGDDEDCPDDELPCQDREQAVGNEAAERCHDDRHQDLFALPVTQKYGITEEAVERAADETFEDPEEFEEYLRGEGLEVESLEKTWRKVTRSSNSSTRSRR